MSESLFDAEFEELFRSNRLYERSSPKPTGEALIFGKLIFGLGLLESQLLQICLPYLEASENRIFDDDAFVKSIKQIAASLRLAMTGYALEAALEVWNEVDQRISTLAIQAKPADVLLSAIAVAAVRCALENLNTPEQPITLFRSRSHAAFYPKLQEVCNASGIPLLAGTTDDAELRNLTTALRRKAGTATPL